MAIHTNPAQKIIMAIIIPIIIILVGYGIMDNLDIYPDELDESWAGWAFVFILIGIIEYYLFKNPKQ